MQRAKPFHRALSMMQLIAQIGMHAAVALTGEYRSRGHGRGGHSGKKWGPQPSGRYARTFNGRQEVARRQRQIAKGIVHV